MPPNQLKPFLASDAVLAHGRILLSQIKKRCGLRASAELPQPNILVGSSNFQKILDREYDIIDKTLFIKDFINGKPEVEVSVILRPRRFGKSLNLSMLRSFLSVGADPRKFERFLIGKDNDFVSEHCGKYPVIFLDMKDCKGQDWNDMFQSLWLQIRLAATSYLTESKKSHGYRQDDPSIGFLENIDPPAPFIVRNILKWLTASMFNTYGEQVILLIDEYDAPLNHAYLKGFYEEASNFFGVFYSLALKGNDALYKACLMGIVEIRGAGILSGLNNVRVYSPSSERFSQYFGFTLCEVRDFLKDDIAADRVLDWYNGYLMGSTLVINPWSFVCYIDAGEFASFWVQSSYLETLSTFLAPHLRNILLESLVLLQKGGVLSVSSLSTEVNYSQQSWHPTSILHFLVLTGYLTYNKEQRSVYIPNTELRTCWERDVLGLIQTTLKEQYGSTLRAALLASWTDTVGLEELMLNLVLSCSYHDLVTENSYHVLYFGFFSGVFSNDQDVFVKSNRESGHGRFDIILGFADLKKAIIFELKEAKSKEKLDSRAKEALQQIGDNQYFSDFAGYDCLLIGVSFHKKRICLQSKHRKC